MQANVEISQLLFFKRKQKDEQEKYNLVYRFIGDQYLH